MCKRPLAPAALVALLVFSFMFPCAFGQVQGRIRYVRFASGGSEYVLVRDAADKVYVGGVEANMSFAACFPEPISLGDARVVLAGGEAAVTLDFAAGQVSADGYMLYSSPCLVTLDGAENFTAKLEVYVDGGWVQVDEFTFEAAVSKHVLSVSMNTMLWVASAFLFILIAFVLMMAFTSRSISEDQILMLIALSIGVVVALVMFNALLA